MISEERAREIASWFQSPGVGGQNFSALASVGVINCTLADDIDREAKAPTIDDEGRKGLAALKAYVTDPDQTKVWRHSIVAGMAVVDEEDEQSVNALRSVECVWCWRQWPKDALNWEREHGRRD